MNIRLPSGSSRLFSWWGRDGCSLSLCASRASEETSGYFSAGVRLISDFFIAREGIRPEEYSGADLWRTNAQYTDVRPDGCMVSFGDIDLEIAFLAEENALCLSVSAGCGIGILLSSDAVPHAASPSQFRMERANSHRIVFVPEEVISPEAVSARPGDRRFVLFLSFGTEAASRKKVDQLALGESATHTAISVLTSPRQQVLSCIPDSTGFADAVRWAQHTATGLADCCSVRELFISFAGTFLCSGRFARAKQELVRFALRVNSLFFDLSDTACLVSGLWFIRALCEYLSYTCDRDIPDSVLDAADIILHEITERHADGHGFFIHGDGDTWMDSRMEDGTPWTQRGNRACEMQALWYTALLVGAQLARMRERQDCAYEREAFARKVQESFRKYFWCPERHALADRLRAGSDGERDPDFSVRPNQLLVISIPSVLDEADAFIDSSLVSCCIENVRRELVTPFGVCSLAPDDPLFHPRQYAPDLYLPGAACNNGLIWLWNSGPFISAVCASSAKTDVSDACALLETEARWILAGSSTTGALDGFVDAAPNTATGASPPVFSGGLPHLPANAEFVRNVFQDIIGFNPRLSEGCIQFHPCLPVGMREWKASVSFGPGWCMDICITRNADGAHRSVLVWETGAQSGIPSLEVNGRQIIPGEAFEIFTAPRFFPASIFPARDFFPDWCGALHQKDYLERLLVSQNHSPLEWFFDSDYFRNRYLTDLPLGAHHEEDHTYFRLWAPTARSVSLVLYHDGLASPEYSVLAMEEGSVAQAEPPGVWSLRIPGDLHGVYYRYRIRVHGIIRDSADPCARACGKNGKRSMVCDFQRTDPEGWEDSFTPELASPNDAVVYEVHVADISSSPSWNGPAELRRTYQGAVAGGTVAGGTATSSDSSVPTGFDHIKSLGVTHVQLLPVTDFSSVDEARLHDPVYADEPVDGLFNWGYDPENFRTPEGSYSLDPDDGSSRVRELKTLIHEFHLAGIGVIMDVVFNHVPCARCHPLNICVPGYYFRAESFSGAGDDTASEREMFRAFMIASLSWWLYEYHLSGFRFDLMGLHDVVTMNHTAEALACIKPDVLLYGEGWDMYRGTKITPANMLQSRKLPCFGFFNDAFRCGIKGTIFAPRDGGFLHSGTRREAIKFGLVGAVYHPQVHNRFVEGTVNPGPWGECTAASVNYTEIHDNSTLYDKLVLVEPGKPEAYYECMQKTAIALVLFAQGMPVLHAGMEFLRTKEIPGELLRSGRIQQDLYRLEDEGRSFSHNSYNLCDRINTLDWERCAAKQAVVRYVRALVFLRRACPLFRLKSEAEVSSRMRFIDAGDGVLVWTIRADQGAGTEAEMLTGTIVTPQAGEKAAGLPLPAPASWVSVCLMVNPDSVPVQAILPPCAGAGGRWHLVADGNTCGTIISGPHNPGDGVSLPEKTLYLYAEF